MFARRLHLDLSEGEQFMMIYLNKRPGMQPIGQELPLIHGPYSIATLIDRLRLYEE